MRWLALSALVTAGCGARACADRVDALAPAGSASAAAFEPIASATTEAVFSLERKAGRCAIFSTLGAEATPRGETGCPRELDDGERMLLRGQTCIRESVDPARSVPIRCAKHLVWAARGQH